MNIEIKSGSRKHGISESVGSITLRADTEEEKTRLVTLARILLKSDKIGYERLMKLVHGRTAVWQHEKALRTCKPSFDVRALRGPVL